MAIANHNGLNKPENCQHYRQLALAKDRATVADMSVALDAEIGSMADVSHANVRRMQLD